MFQIPFKYKPAGHIITSEIKIIDNASPQDVIAKGPKYRDPTSIQWKPNFKILKGVVEDFARQSAKREGEI